ncbi:hypothetical protein QFC19_006778 [Naganishia cerealis]|uniref:Uncharacterized protein n=1 Tax=Naganishia cerealis TaxID=610337 RepID=A0ACC2VE54_9TREE|nr:hypothetical protein QFC19_006778 [Naganishia cerealis]
MSHSIPVSIDPRANDSTSSSYGSSLQFAEVTSSTLSDDLKCSPYSEDVREKLENLELAIRQLDACSAEPNLDASNFKEFLDLSKMFLRNITLLFPRAKKKAKVKRELGKRELDPVRLGEIRVFNERLPWLAKGEKQSGDTWVIPEGSEFHEIVSRGYHEGLLKCLREVVECLSGLGILRSDNGNGPSIPSASTMSHRPSQITQAPSSDTTTASPPRTLSHMSISFLLQETDTTAQTNTPPIPPSLTRLSTGTSETPS